MFLPTLLSFVGLVCASRTLDVDKLSTSIDANTADFSASTVDSLVIDRQLSLFEVVTGVLRSLPEYPTMDIFPLKLSSKDPVGEPLVAKRVNLEMLRRVHSNQCKILSAETCDLNVLDTTYYPSKFMGKQGNAESHLIVTRQSATGIILSLFEIFGQ